MTKEDYRALIKQALADGNEKLQTAADAAGISLPYLSRVLRGNGDLTAEQIFLIGRLLKWNDARIRVVINMANSSAAQGGEYAKFVERERDSLNEQSQKLTQQLSDKNSHFKIQTSQAASFEYYLNPHFQVIHMALEIKKYQTDLARLATRLRLAEDVLYRTVEKMIHLGFLKRIGKRVVPEVTRMHLEQGDFISQQNHSNWRLYALRNLDSNEKGNYQYTATVCANKWAFQQLRDNIKKMIAQFSKELEGESEEVFQLNIDLFHILKDA